VNANVRSQGPVMSFETADAVVDRLSDALQAERRVGGSFIALEWIGSWSVTEVMRALFLVLASNYREGFPMSRTSADFQQFASAAGGAMVGVLTSAFPMSELARLDRCAHHSPEWWELSGALTEKGLSRCQWDIETAESFAVWLKSVDPSYDDYEPMVNHYINQRSPHLAITEPA